MRSSSLPLLLLALSGATSLLLPALPRPQTAQPRVATAPHCVIDAPVQKVDSASTTDAAAARNDAANSDVEATSANLLKQMEDGLEAMTSDPQRILEAVVGLPGVARYDRDAIVDYFKQRPALMVTRAVDFLLAFRRIRAAWTSGDGQGQGSGGGRDRGEVLRSELAQLGPVAVKIGQTLSQRPDILPEDVCEALKSLQTNNKPFPNEEAYRVIAEDFNATGPLAPGIPALDGYDADGPTLFRQLTPDCIASASLGQVYRATLHDGREAAIKVQRPGALRQCLLDGSVIILALKAIQGKYWNGDLLAIFDTVASGVVQELDFRNEAANAAAFRESLRFLGYVDVPQTFPELTTRRAMAMEWVYGRHLSDLQPEEAMRMTYMSCEAVTAGLVLTGLVHADPHEGNIMLADDGRLVFLDFGLMSRVEENIMEAFASGIQCVLAKDYGNLVQAFMDTGFIGTPIEWRAKEADPWQLTHPDGDAKEVMAKELRERMEACPGGGSRFGALSTVLADMGFTWQMYTPPYVILLIRTFLTLEGIAGKVDPEFNIYEVALPWAIERALSPSTDTGAQTLRASLLNDANQFQWERVEALIEQQKADAKEAAEAAAAAAEAAAAATSEGEGEGEAAGALPEAMSARARLMSGEASQATLDPALAAAGAEAQAAQAATPLDSLTTVLGSARKGRTLRRIARDVDSTELLLSFAAPSARPMRRMAVEKLSDALAAGVKRRAAAAGTTVTAKLTPTSSTAEAAPAQGQAWPKTEEARQMERRASARARTASLLLLRTHLARQVAAGWRGVAAVGALAYVTLRVGLAAVVRTLCRSSGSLVAHALPARAIAPVAALAARVVAWGGREMAALGASMSELADDLDAATRRMSTREAPE